MVQCHGELTVSSLGCSLLIISLHLSHRLRGRDQVDQKDGSMPSNDSGSEYSEAPHSPRTEESIEKRNLALKKILGHPADVSGLKKCLVCLKIFLDCEYMDHVATHLKESVTQVEKLGSREWFTKNDSLIIKQSKPIIDPLEGLDEETKASVLEEYRRKFASQIGEDELMQLLNQDYAQNLQQFYIHPDRRLHQGIQYKLQPDPKPFHLP